MVGILPPPCSSCSFRLTSPLQSIRMVYILIRMVRSHPAALASSLQSICMVCSQGNLCFVSSLQSFYLTRILHSQYLSHPQSVCLQFEDTILTREYSSKLKQLIFLQYQRPQIELKLIQNNTLHCLKGNVVGPSTILYLKCTKCNYYGNPRSN